VGIRAFQRSIALAIFGILVSLVIAILVAVKAPTAAIVTCASVTLALIVLLYLPELRRFYRDTREERQRRTRRKQHNLRLVEGDEADLSPALLPDGVFGYEEIFSVSGLRDGRARIKPDRTKPEGVPYPLELHKFEGDTWLVGYVSAKDRDKIHRGGELNLWMRRRSRDDTLEEIPLSRLKGDGESRGDRSWDSGAKNIFRLVLNLGPTDVRGTERRH
jgi:hypothetical protein